MNFFGKAAEAADDILRAFESPNTLPAPLANIFVWRNDGSPCRSWSWRNQMLAALHGHKDARRFRQWQEIGRHVKKGEKSFTILSPCMKKVVDEKTGEEKSFVVGFRGTAVFGVGQTDGDPLPEGDLTLDHWLDSLPVREVAGAWGLTVETYNGGGGDKLGVYQRGTSIGLGVKNLSTWAHELIHAAEFRNGTLKELGQHWRSEIVAELGGAVLLTLLGYPHEADLGGCMEYVKRYADRRGIDIHQACNVVLKRTCEAVALVLDTAEALKSVAGVAA